MLEGRSPRSLFLPAALVFLLALFLRWGYVYEIRDTPFFERPIVDSGQYLERAEKVIRGTSKAVSPIRQASGRATSRPDSCGLRRNRACFRNRSQRCT